MDQWIDIPRSCFVDLEGIAIPSSVGKSHDNLRFELLSSGNDFNFRDEDSKFIVNHLLFDKSQPQINRGYEGRTPWKSNIRSLISFLPNIEDFLVLLNRNDVDHDFKVQATWVLIDKYPKLAAPKPLCEYEIDKELVAAAISSRQFSPTSTFNTLLAAGFPEAEAAKLTMTLRVKYLKSEARGLSVRLEELKSYTQIYDLAKGVLSDQERLDVLEGLAMFAAKAVIMPVKGKSVSEQLQIFQELMSEIYELGGVGSADAVEDFVNRSNSSKRDRIALLQETLFEQRFMSARTDKTKKITNAADVVISHLLASENPGTFADAAIKAVLANRANKDFYLALLQVDPNPFILDYAALVIESLGKLEELHKPGELINGVRTLDSVLTDFSDAISSNPAMHRTKSNFHSMVCRPEAPTGLIARLADSDVIDPTTVWEKIIVPKTGSNIVSGIEPSKGTVMKALANMSPFADPKTFTIKPPAGRASAGFVAHR